MYNSNKYARGILGGGVESCPHIVSWEQNQYKKLPQAKLKNSTTLVQQFFIEVEHDIENYWGQGLCYPQKVEDIKNIQFWWDF